MLPILLSFLLASCSDQPPATDVQPAITSTSTPTKTPSPTQPPQPTAIPTQPAVFDLDDGDLRNQEVQFWYVLPERVHQVAPLDPVEEAVEAFNRTNKWGIRVEAAAYGNYDLLVDEVEAALYSDMPELISGYSFHLAHLDESAGILVDLSPYISDSIWGFASAERQDFYLAFWEQDVSRGRRLGIPFYRSFQALFYNQTWASELNIEEPPQTPQEFQEQACDAAVANEGDDEKQKNSGGWIINNDVPAVLSWLYSFDGSISSSQENGYQVDEEASSEVFSFLKELYQDNCSWKPVELDSHDLFSQRQALLVSSSITGISLQEAAMEKAGSSDDWTVIPYPGVSGVPAVDAYGPSLAVIESNERQQMAAWIFAKWLLSPENQANLSQAAGTIPVRASAVDYMGDYLDEHPQWADAVELVEYARTEPSAPSWSFARWTFRDAAYELYRPSFIIEMIPDLVQMLANTLNELEDQY